MNITAFFERLLAGKDLTREEMQQIMQACMEGRLSDLHIAVFLALIRAKGETVEELSAAASVMMANAHQINLGEGLIDIVGTGGDGKNTFNISTVSSIVAAAAGARVAKHGNHSVSSKSGSADLLLAAGIPLQLSDRQLQACLQKTNVCFLFAPQFHQAMKQVKNARQQLGVRSFFNLLGPLVNPARVKRQVVGVFDKHWQPILAQVLAQMGSERALVISSRDGMDEASIVDVTEVIEYHHGQFSNWTLNPRDFGCSHASLNAITVSSPAESLALIEQVLAGKSGPARDIVLLNSALALYCAEIGATLSEAVNIAADTIDSGHAKHCFTKLQELTKDD